MEVKKKRASPAPRPTGPDSTPMQLRARAFVSRLQDNLSIGCHLEEESLEALMTHPHPPARLRDLRDALRRAAVAKSEARWQEHLIKVLRQCADIVDLKEFGSLGVCTLAYLATFGSDLRLLCDSAQAAAAALGIGREAAMHSALAPLVHLPINEEIGTGIVVAACKQAWSLILPAYADAARPFARWDAYQRAAAVKLIEFGYGLGRVSSLGLVCSRPEELAEDLRTRGAPALRALISESAVNEQATRIARLLLSVDAHAPTQGDHVAVPTGMLVVCPFEIPPSAERADKEEIARHQALRRPFPVRRLPERAELERTRLRLLEEFPWADSAIEVLVGELIGMKALGVRDLVLPPTLLIGPPGSGKTRLARRVAEELELPRIDVALGGSADAKALAGTSRGWAGGRPGDVVTFLASQGSASALVLLDELDKAGGSYGNTGGSVHSFLLALLEPETASRHYDCFLKTPCDLSRVSWICTANQLSTLPAALKSRLRVLAVPAPRREHAEAIARAALRDLEARWQLPPGTAPNLEQIGLRVHELESARQLRVAVEAGLLEWSRRHRLH